MKRLAIVASSALMAATFLFAVGVLSSYAANKGDCDKVMEELDGGRSGKDVASDLGISRPSVYRCKRHAKAEAQSGSKSMPENRGEPVGSPAMMPSAAASAAPEAH